MIAWTKYCVSWFIHAYCTLAWINVSRGHRFLAWWQDRWVHYFVLRWRRRWCVCCVWCVVSILRSCRTLLWIAIHSVKCVSHLMESYRSPGGVWRWTEWMRCSGTVSLDKIGRFTWITNKDIRIPRNSLSDTTHRALRWIDICEWELELDSIYLPWRGCLLFGDRRRKPILTVDMTNKRIAHPTITSSTIGVPDDEPSSAESADESAVVLDCADTTDSRSSMQIPISTSSRLIFSGLWYYDNSHFRADSSYRWTRIRASGQTYMV